MTEKEEASPLVKLASICFLIALIGAGVEGILYGLSWVEMKASEQVEVIEITKTLAGHAPGSLVLYPLDAMGCRAGGFDRCGSLLSLIPPGIVLSDRQYPALIRIPERPTLLSITRYSWPLYIVLSLYIVPTPRNTTTAVQ